MSAETIPRDGAAVPQILQSIRNLLASLGIPFREVHHAPTRTSEESAAARGEPLHIGGKALLMKGDDEQFRLFVLPADEKLDSQAIRQTLGLKKNALRLCRRIIGADRIGPGVGFSIRPADSSI